MEYKDIGWKFTKNDGGRIQGISDGGIETFNGAEIRSLTREICQNSLDALVDNSSDPVLVKFNCHYIEKDDLPGHEYYLRVLEKAEKFAAKDENIKTVSFFKTAQDIMLKGTIPVLQISDYNTTGLDNPFETYRGGWIALTKADGGATKSGDKGGSFGIGKNAAFSNSKLRLVFYRTLNEKGEIAAQGISRIVSFPEDEMDCDRTMTTGFGCYGTKEMCRPIESIQQLDNLSKREEVGTDIFIYGFNATSNNWVDEVIIELLTNFLMAIYNRQLVVCVENNEIRSDNIGEYIEHYKDNLKHSYAYYQVLTNQETKCESYNFHDMGRLHLKVLINQNESLNRKVLVTRKSGMKLFEIQGLPRHIDFSAIIEMSGFELNKYFREMEPPTHDKWVPERHTNVNEAKKFRKELIDWVRNEIIKMGAEEIGGEIVVEGLPGDLHHNHTNIIYSKDGKKEEYLSNDIEDIIILPRNESQRVKQTLVNGKIGTGGTDAVRKLSGRRKRKTKQSHSGIEKSDGKDLIKKSTSDKQSVYLINPRIIKVGPKQYRTLFKVNENIKNGSIEIEAIAETGKNFPLHIDSVQNTKSCVGMKVSSKKIMFQELFCKDKIQFEFSLFDNNSYAMEVKVYEDNE